jgi:succinate dehydrogenase hydrophobic anchor subunit
MRGNVLVRDGDRTAQQRPRPSPTRGWIGQVVSGGLLLVLVTVHMVANHFVVRGGLRSYAQVVAYVGNPLILAVEIAFLLVVTWHAMSGIRAVLLDLGLRGRAQRVTGRVLAGLGLTTVAYGLWLLATIASKA